MVNKHKSLELHRSRLMENMQTNDTCSDDQLHENNLDWKLETERTSNYNDRKTKERDLRYATHKKSEI